MVMEKAGRQGVEEIVMGMPHRGRLNVLANIMGKHPREIFREFKDEEPEQHIGRGDVRYHLGYHRDWETVSGQIIHLALAFNPSHLEYVCPVSQGRLRAKMDRMDDKRRERGLLILIHGDASFAGEGIIQETLNLSQLPAYEVGGTLHVVVNNQIGFTTPPEQGRSSAYATDIARMLQVPVFHVNGEKPEAVAQAVELALDFRKEFGQDAVIDMYCYRRRGHNEADEPTFTQPLMYKEIKQHPTVRESYLKQLVRLNELTGDEAQRIADDRRAYLETEYANARPTLTDLHPDRKATLGHIWTRYRGGKDGEVAPVDTAVERGVLVDILARLAEVPDDFNPHRKIRKLLDVRRAMSRGEQKLDWGAAEALALGTLAVEGTRVRLSGQDSERGTFSHRHAVLHDTETAARFEPLNHLSEGQAPVEIVNSPLCEGGVLGFEYGYSLSRTDGLVIWEAQFGDFANAAQVYIDQFIAAAEEKWEIFSGLVMLLPHALEGTGPEHASARIERFLSLAAQDNFQLVNPTTPAQYFHCLRRQVLSPWRKPLVVFSPKGLLRHPGATSTLDELSGGGFNRVLLEEISGPVERVILTSGKLFYELDAERKRRERDDVAMVRVEQLHPLPWSLLEQTLAHFPDGTPVLWVQEEPANMGAYPHFRLEYGDRINGRWSLHGVTRPASTTPSTGSAASHKLEQRELLARAFGPLEN